MTTTKKYRAATLREALEQVKRELGENALVLDSKNVRVGGFLGVKGRDMVEVSVAVPEDGDERPARPETHAQRANNLLLLNLSDESPATPASAAAPAPHFASAEPAAYARPFSSAPFQAPEATEAGGPAAAPEPPPRGIELAETAPRVVHRAPTAAAVPPAKPSAESGDEPGAHVPRPGTPSEFERLRSELREMKFYLGALAARGTGQESALREEAAWDRVSAGPEYEAARQAGLLEAFNELTSTGIPADLAELILTTADDSVVHDPRALLEAALPALASFAEDLFAPQAAEAEEEATAAAAFVGPTGVGKTTTIAKLAARLSLREGRRIELITMDTARIGAIEQLRAYADIIGAGFNVVRTTLELDVLIRRLSREAAVLIDTMGRNPHDLADQLELADYLAAQPRVRKCLVLPATTHPADALAAVKKYSLYGVDRLVLTKLDETSRPGASVAIAAEAALPLTYLCAGQRVPEDIEGATPHSFARRLLRGGTLAAYAAAA